MKDSAETLSRHVADTIREGLGKALAVLSNDKVPRRHSQEAPFRHDIKAQYQKLYEIVKTTDADEIGPLLRAIVKGGEYCDARATLKFNPVTLEYLKHLLEISGDERHGQAKT